MTKTKSQKSKKNNQKKKRPVFLTALIIITIIFAVGGFFTFNLLTANDKFEIIGEKEITLILGEDYTENGVKIISFGKDKSQEVSIENNIDTSTTGTYYVKYTAKDWRFKNVVRYRYITVVEA